MKKLVAAFVLLFVVFQKVDCRAQVDTSFWFAAPWVTPDHWWRDDIKLHISTFAAPTTTVWLRQPAAIMPNRYDTMFVLPANTTFNYTFWRDKIASPSNMGYDSLEVRPANTVLPYGLYVSSSANITVVYDVITRSPSFLNPETFSLKGRNALGTEFFCPFQTKWNNITFVSSTCGSSAADLNCDGTVTQPKQQINVVATASNTIIWITPKCNVVGHLASVSYSVLLNNAGDAYTIENAVQTTTVSGQNLSGTHITSNKAIAVTVNDDSVRGLGGCYDLMGDQIVPLDAIGTDYVLNKGNLNAMEPEGAFIVGTQNNTQITVNDGAVITTTLINQGDTYHYKTTQPLTYVNADKDVYCLHATGIGCELGEALLPPITCAGSGLVSFSRNTPQNFYLNLLCKNGSQSTFTLNNSAGSVLIPITASNFSVVPGTATLAGGPYYGAQLSLNSTTLLPLGSYTIGNTTDVFAVGVFEGGSVTGASYHYLSSFLQRTSIVTSTASAAPVCIGTNTIALTATVSGGAVTGSFTAANGSGTVGAYSSTVGTVATVYTLSASDTLLSSLKFYFTSMGSCKPVKDSILVPLSPRPFAFAGNNSSQCKNNVMPVALTGTVVNALGGSWSGGSGSFGAPGTITSYTPSAADLVAGAVTLSLTSQGSQPGCGNAVSTLTVSFLNPPTVSITPNGTAVCAGQTATLTASGAANYTWSSGSNNAGTTLTPVATNTYIVIGADLAGCIGQATTQVVVNALPIMAIGGNSAACQGSTVTLTGSGATTYSWNGVAGTASLAVSPSVTTQYTLTGADSNGCQSAVTTILLINALPNLSVTVSKPQICVGESSLLKVFGAASYSWSTGSAADTLLVSPTSNTVYVVTGTAANGCTASVAVTQSVSACTGIQAAELQDEVLLIYPNPNTGDFMIDGACAQLNLALVNELGQVVRQVVLDAPANKAIALTGIANGIYQLYGTCNNRPVKARIVVQR